MQPWQTTRTRIPTGVSLGAPRFWDDVDVTSRRRLSCDALTKPLFLVPDVVEGPNGKKWIPSPMRSAKFCKCLRAILVVAGLQAHDGA